MTAAIAKIEENILGWDFIKKYKLNFIWEKDECFLYDKKAKIKKQLDFVSFPHLSRPHMHSVHALDSSSLDKQVEEMLFSTAAMKMCDNNAAEEVNHQPEYKALIDKYPQILKTEFSAKSKG